MPGPKMQAAFVLLGTLGIGILLGVTGERFRANSERPPREGFRRPPVSRDGGFREGRLPPPFERLDLTAEQQTQIRETMERYGPLTRAVMDEMVPRLRALRDSAQTEIEALLTNEQRQRLAEMEEDFWDRRWEGRRGRRGGRRDSSRGPAPPFAPPPDSGRFR